MPPTLRAASATLLITGGLATLPACGAETLDARLATDHLDLRLERVVSGLEHPWAVAQLPDGRWLITERPGRLLLIGETGEHQRVSGVPEVASRGQGGLLDLELHPDYGDGEHDWLYFTWSRPGPGGAGTALSRARLEGTQLVDIEHLFAQKRFTQSGRHFGSRLAWLPDATLLMSVGERGEPDRAQATDDHAGSFLRFTETGEVPPDNPFVGDPTALDALYTLGNRNPQGLTVAADGTAWSTEHGPRTGDELNRIEPGVNYGWPMVTRGRDYVTNLPIGRDSAPGMRDPVHVFEGRFAPSGLTEVRGDTFSAWRGHLLAGGLASEQLVRLALRGGKVVDREVILEGEIGRIRDVYQAEEGAIYLLTDADDGSLYRLIPAE